MGSNLRRPAANGSAVHTAEFIVSSARLAELHECSALLRRTRMRSEEIVDEARTLLLAAEGRGDADLVPILRDRFEEARASYDKVLIAYVAISRRINEERLSIVQAQMERDRKSGLSGVA
ncbi:hypothetical protein HII36_02585 [Nonomuraea sp. NN258]|uniref:hypothetical protein n=1 Tax=Nonomuraea antri TaxID=2730852 RepID=UPI0015699E6C|nr:hypothetical protein [Nonomuraea antri]NRQ30725.1 hypothetical protein [Nonomuraea antri]